MNGLELRDVMQNMIYLCESWRNGVCQTFGMEWIEEPKAIVAARRAIEQLEYQLCTGDSFTCPVGHDHP